MIYIVDSVRMEMFNFNRKHVVTGDSFAVKFKEINENVFIGLVQRGAMSRIKRQAVARRINAMTGLDIEVCRIGVVIFENNNDALVLVEMDGSGLRYMIVEVLGRMPLDSFITMPTT